MPSLEAFLCVLKVTRSLRLESCKFVGWAAALPRRNHTDSRSLLYYLCEPSDSTAQIIKSTKNSWKGKKMSTKYKNRSTKITTTQNIALLVPVCSWSSPKIIFSFVHVSQTCTITTATRQSTLSTRQQPIGRYQQRTQLMVKLRTWILHLNVPQFIPLGLKDVKILASC